MGRSDSLSTTYWRSSCPQQRFFLILIVVSIILLSTFFSLGKKSGSKYAKGECMNEQEFFNKLRNSKKRSVSVVGCIKKPATIDTTDKDCYFIIVQMGARDMLFSIDFLTVESFKQYQRTGGSAQDVKRIAVNGLNEIVFKNEYERTLFYKP